MSPRIAKRRVLLERISEHHAGTKPDLLPAVEYARVLDDDTDDEIDNPTLWLSGEDYRDLGEPEQITVTIEPGDLLNDGEVSA